MTNRFQQKTETDWKYVSLIYIKVHETIPLHLAQSTDTSETPSQWQREEQILFYTSTVISSSKLSEHNRTLAISQQSSSYTHRLLGVWEFFHVFGAFSLCITQG